jgi:ribosomal protein S18 acetylase RimI-like enzyme
MNLIIREATELDAENITVMHIKSWQETYKDIIDQVYLDDLPNKFEERLKFRQDILSKKDQAIHLVAEKDGKIIGFCDASFIREYEGAKGEVYAIYLLKEYQGSGIGKKLFQQAVEFLFANNLAPFVVLVLKDNLPSRKFYEKNGGVEIDMETIEIDGKTYEEVRYIFKDLS